MAFRVSLCSNILIISFVVCYSASAIEGLLIQPKIRLTGKGRLVVTSAFSGNDESSDPSRSIGDVVQGLHGSKYQGKLCDGFCILAEADSRWHKLDDKKEHLSLTMASSTEGASLALQIAA